MLYLCHNGVKSRLKVYYRAQRPGGPVCSIVSGHVTAPLCRKDQQSGEPFPRLQVRAKKAQALALLRRDRLMNLAAWLQTNKADTELHLCDAPTTTLPSEGHQNVLVNAAFVLPRVEGGGRWAQDVFVQPQQQPVLGFGVGVERADVIFQRGCCITACFTFGLTRCESLQRGGRRPRSYYRWNVAYGGWTAGEDGCMQVGQMDPVWLMCG